jgi:hypothetical protein
MLDAVMTSGEGSPECTSSRPLGTWEASGSEFQARPSPLRRSCSRGMELRVAELVNLPCSVPACLPLPKRRGSKLNPSLRDTLESRPGSAALASVAAPPLRSRNSVTRHAQDHLNMPFG